MAWKDGFAISGDRAQELPQISPGSVGCGGRTSQSRSSRLTLDANDRISRRLVIGGVEAGGPAAEAGLRLETSSSRSVARPIDGIATLQDLRVRALGEELTLDHRGWAGGRSKVRPRAMPSRRDCWDRSDGRSPAGNPA